MYPDRKKYRSALIAFFMLLLCLTAPGIPAMAAERVQPVDDTVVIVIDPGHGGDNLGTESGHTIEKEMTMITAKAMFEELEKYDNVKVYLTHSEDKDMSLKERAKFAAEVHADFLYSIHYNASENHSMFGTEVWISCVAPFNAYGYQFGYNHLRTMADEGLFVRGVKNRQNEKGTDYYGIIRESAALDVPAVIIEHCYVDEERDADYVATSFDWREFGRADALSVAQYFGLKSTELGVDYSKDAVDLPEVSADTVLKSTLQDLTKPDVCVAELTTCDYDTGNVSLTISAADYDSPLIYYNYSLNRGQTWSRLESWPGSDTLTGAYTDTFVLNLQIPDGVKPSIIVRAYNITDIYRESNVITFDRKFSYDTDAIKASRESEAKQEATAATQPPDHAHKSLGTTTFKPASGSLSVEEEKDYRLMTFLKISLVIVILLFLTVLISQAVNYRRRKRRRWDSSSDTSPHSRER